MGRVSFKQAIESLQAPLFLLGRKLAEDTRAHQVQKVNNYLHVKTVGSCISGRISCCPVPKQHGPQLGQLFPGAERRDLEAPLRGPRGDGMRPACSQRPGDPGLLVSCWEG